MAAVQIDGYYSGTNLVNAKTVPVTPFVIGVV
jgi:hypothetical protein